MTHNNTDIKINLDNNIKWCNEVLKSVFLSISLIFRLRFFIIKRF